jgi:protocatechuate 3,4-dioxygenase beta subunit
MHLRLKVVDEDGAPVGGRWSRCGSERGRALHPSERRRPRAGRPQFYGAARVLTDESGGRDPHHKPGAYPVPDRTTGGTPHIHFGLGQVWLSRPSRRCLLGEPLNAEDRILNAILSAAGRESPLPAPPTSEGPSNALVFEFRLVVRGPCRGAGGLASGDGLAPTADHPRPFFRGAIVDDGATT